MMGPTMRRALPVLALAVLAWAWPAAGAAGTVRYRIQPELTELRFKATSRLMDADGTFRRFAGEVTVDPKDARTARVTLTIEAASIDTGIRLRDNHLRSAEFLDVERYPSITFESVRVDPADRRATVVGRLTIHGVTRQLTVPIEVELAETTLLARGELALRRSDFGITYQSVLNPVGDLVRVAFVFRGRAER
jgi:polyisoprenoid-binding protein YceI